MTAQLTVDHEPAEAQDAALLAPAVLVVDDDEGYFFGRPFAAEDLAPWLTESPYGPAAGNGGASALRS